jgi:hypothetical protein
MAESIHPPDLAQAARTMPPAFRPLAGVHVLMKALPRDVLEACRATPDSLSLKILAGQSNRAWLGPAKTPEQLMARFNAPNKVCADDVPIHLDVSFEELATWQLDPKFSILAYYPMDKGDLPNVLYALGYFGAIIVDFKLYQDDLPAALAWLQGLNTALGEVVAILPRETYATLSGLGAPGPTYDTAKAVPIRIAATLTLIFGREAVTPDERFAADNDLAAWCEAIDYASLSPRLELKIRHERVGGVQQALMGAHYRMVNCSKLYRRIANRIAATDSALDMLLQRTANDFEYFSWRYLRGGKRK